MTVVLLEPVMQGEEILIGMDKGITPESYCCDMNSKRFPELGKRDQGVVFILALTLCTEHVSL